MTPQAPIPSGFGPASTAEEVSAGIDLTGRTAIVTGGYSGLGRETARVLAMRGARVIVPARDMVKAEAALAGLAGIELRPMDLMDPASIDAFAERVLADVPVLHILVNSAAIMANPLTRDSRGYESQFATNHLGHFQLTGRLWPVLAAARGARVVAVSSRGHRFAGVDLDDPNFERRPYEPNLAYGQAKTANALFAVELDRRGRGQGVRAFSLHPGGIITPLARFMDPEVIRASGFIDADGRPVIDPANDKKTVEQGAATSVWCATSPQLEGMGGVYCEDSDIASPTTGEGDRPAGVADWARAPVIARRLWALSEALTGVRFPG